jgi:hypothetical protein
MARRRPLLDQVRRPVASFTGDGAYDRDDVYGEVAARHPDAAVIAPPRSTAVLSETVDIAPTKRDEHLQRHCQVKGVWCLEVNPARLRG